MSLKDDRLQVGSVIFEHVKNTNPPKDKYYVIIGFSNDKVALGTVFINSEINPNIFRNERMRDLHVFLPSSENPFLKWDSYIDFSDIQERFTADVEACITNGGEHGYVATLSTDTMAHILTKLDNAFTIAVNKKIKYGIRK